MDLSRDICLIPGYELYTNYDIDITGKLRNSKSGRHINGCKTRLGAIRYHLKQDGQFKTILMHKAVKILFDVDVPPS